jgi:hypothetical protein
MSTISHVYKHLASPYNQSLITQESIDRVNRKQPVQGRVYLSVPYAEKESVKDLGGHWSVMKKKWYCLPEDQQLFQRWIKPKRTRRSKHQR